MALSYRLVAAAECGWHWLSSRAVCSSAWRSGRHRRGPQGGRRDATTPHIPYMEVHPRVADAIASGFPVVAMETTIVTHGMPYPENLMTAMEVEDTVESLNAVPATIGILDGKVHVGLTKMQLERLADSAQKKFKVSRRDLAYVLSQGHCGGTTVSATMLCAHKAGIEVFVTGGIGGVHREGENTLDISADLVELGRTPVAVVCGGVKSILDIGRTLEVLETHGVTVVTYGPDKEFPAFFTPKSGYEAPFNVETPLQCAKLIESNQSFSVGSGLLVAVPIPPDAGCLGDEIEQATQRALIEAKNAGVMGKAVTPFVLQRVNELTAGRSLQANIVLVKNNAKVGARIAVELAALRSNGPLMDGGQALRHGSHTTGGGQALRHGSPTTCGGQAHHAVRTEHYKCKGDKQVVVVGGSVLDISAKVRSPQVKSEGTNPGSMTHSFGGVARNIVECLSRLGTSPFFITAIGDDTSGQRITENLQECGVSLAGVLRSEGMPTATYCVVLDGNGETHCAVGDMDVLETISPEWVGEFSDVLEGASLVCTDANIPEATVKLVCDICWRAGVPVWYEPTCLEKAVKSVLAGCHSQLSYTSPSLSELRSMVAALTGQEVQGGVTAGLSLEEKLNECRRLCPSLLPHIPNVLVSLGGEGLVYARRGEKWGEGGGQGRNGRMELLHYPPAASHLLPVGVVSVTGAGDSFVGGMISGLVRGLNQDIAIKAGLRAAHLSVLSQSPVSERLTPELFTEESLRMWAPWSATMLWQQPNNSN